MNGELSHNLPQLVAPGNHILRSDTMRPVLLRGVNRSGMEYSEPSDAGFLASAGLTEDEIREIVLNWRANIIRLPFNQDWVLRGRRGHSAEDYLASLDQVISWAAALERIRSWTSNGSTPIRCMDILGMRITRSSPTASHLFPMPTRSGFGKP